jgi:hypothetical protein
MWYKKAMDLNDLNKEFAIEKENAVEDYDEQAMKEGVEDLFSKVRAGEQYTSPSGAIRVMPPREEAPFTDEEVDGKFTDESADSYDVYEGIRGFVDSVGFDSRRNPLTIEGTINKFKNLASVTLSRYIDSGVLQEFIRKLDSLSPTLEEIINKAKENVDLIEESFNDPVLSRKYDQEGYPQMSIHDVEAANRITLQITKAINELYNSIRNEDARQEWLNAMARKGVSANFLRPADKTRYKQTMNDVWGL